MQNHKTENDRQRNNSPPANYYVCQIIKVFSRSTKRQSRIGSLRSDHVIKKIQPCDSHLSQGFRTLLLIRRRVRAGNIRYTDENGLRSAGRKKKLQIILHDLHIASRIPAVNIRIHILTVYDELVDSFLCKFNQLPRYGQAGFGAQPPCIAAYLTEGCKKSGLQ